MMKILQGNMHRSKTANDLLTQLCFEKNADLLIISEQYQQRDSSSWYADNLGTAAIWVLDTDKTPVEDHGSGNGFVWVKSKRVTFVSCYFTPNERIGDFRQKLQELEDSLRETDGDTIVAGDLNARALEWGMPQPDSRGKLIMEMVARLGLIVLNTGTTSTFRRPGYRETIPDISLASEQLAPRVSGWVVIEDYTGSDHQYITFCLSPNGQQTATTAGRNRPMWNVTRMNKERFITSLRRRENTTRTHVYPTDRENAEALVEDTMRLIHEACNSSMPRKNPRKNRRPAYWWTEDIANLRRKCLQLRRRAQRSRRGPEAALRSAEHKTAKKELRDAIKRSKANKWQTLTEEVDKNPWGLGYKIVTKKLRATISSPVLTTETTNHIVNTLFPTHPVREDEEDHIEVGEIPAFTEEELVKAVTSLQNNKAPGPDGVPAEALKAATHACPQMLLDMYNSCLNAGVFAARWKVARLVLTSKGKGDLNSPSSYRPLCMLDTAGKLLEKLLKPRVLLAVQEAGGLSDNQYGFRRGRSTVDAVRQVVETAWAAEQGNHHSRKICTLVTLDVKNAFNSARWSDMLHAMERTFNVPKYLLRMIRSYLKERVLVYDTEEGERRREITAGAAQGSILGPDLWNVSYDSLLRLKMPKDTFLVGYADDVAAVIVARSTELAQFSLNQVMRQVNGWMEQHGLSLATAKTEIVLLTKKRIPTIVPMIVGTETIQTKEAAKYLGVIIDTKLNFWEQIKRASDKAASVTAALSRLMTNTNGPRPSKRRLLMTVTESMLLYGAEIWADALRKEKYRKRMASVQRRGALRVACAYRTVSEPAVLVIAGVTPISLLANERKRIFERKRVVGKAQASIEARARTLERWQEIWETDLRGRWTKRLIRDLRAWVDRKHGEVNYYLTQFLSGHGYFIAYLHKMGKVDSPACPYNDASHDDAHHTFFHCRRWNEQRRVLEEELGEITPENVIELMLRSEGNWTQMTTYIELILREKKREGHI